MTGDFVHLHMHSEYSLLDGCAPVGSIPARAASLGMRAVALTDHGVMHGVVQFVKAARAAGVQPIIGCELYIRDDSQALSRDGALHLTVLAQDATGYANLCLLSTLGHLSERRGLPCVSKDQLIEHRRGLVVLSGCLAAEVPRLLAAGRYDDARRTAGWFLEWFGPERYYLELMDSDLPVQRRVNEGLLRLHRELGIDVVATRNVHYLTPEDASVQQLLHCIKEGRRLDDPDRLRSSGRLYFASPAEMAAAFAAVPEALTNTVAVAERCTFALDFEARRLPAFPAAAEHGGSAALLRSLVREGVLDRYGPSPSASVWARVEHELEIIEQTGFTDYFLIVWDLVRFARSAGIAVGPGRGSSASSVVAYALAITDVDPIAHGLLFERFLNPERVTMPDIDIDFCFERRHEVIEYAVKRYGADRVAQICTFGTLGARAAVRDVGRVLGVSPAEVDRVARLIPQGPGVTLDEALAQVPALAAEAGRGGDMSRVIALARKVEGLPRHLSVHAAGIVIAPEPLAATVPLCKSSDGAIVTQYSGEDLESLGFLKMDLLGLRTLTVMDKAVQLIARERGVVVDLGRLPLDDQAVYRMLRSGEAEGVFQLETGMFRSLLREVQPERFDDLIAILALGRPGPMARLSDYLRFRRGEAEAEYVHPALAPILAESCGVMLYQEQVMQIASAVAGYTAGEADLLRRAISKKMPEVMEDERRRFVEAAVTRGLAERAAAQLFDEIAHFAEYGFPKSHSAAYARVAYQTAYLKAHYPAEYMAALLSSVSGSTERTGRYLAECRRLGLDLAGPDVNESGVDFTVHRGKIRFGLAAVKYVGRALAEEIVARRASAPFRSLEDFCARMPSSALSRKAVESLIRVGAFASTGTTRKAALAALDRALAGRGLGGSGRRQFTLFADEPAPPVGGGGEEFSLRQRLADEMELLGIYVTASPGDLYREVLAAYRLPEPGRANAAVVGGVVLAVSEGREPEGRPFLWAALEDAAGKRCEVMLPVEDLREARELKPGAVVLVKGRLEEEGGAWKLLAQSARILEGDPVEIEVASADALARVRRMLTGEGGGRPVILAITGERTRARLLLPPRYWVRADDSFAGQGVNES